MRHKRRRTGVPSGDLQPRPRSRLVGMALMMPCLCAEYWVEKMSYLFFTQDEGMDFAFTDDILALGPRDACFRGVAHQSSRSHSPTCARAPGLAVYEEPFESFARSAVSAAWTTGSWRKSSFPTLTTRAKNTETSESYTLHHATLHLAVRHLYRVFPEEPHRAKVLFYCFRSKGDCSVCHRETVLHGCG